MENKEIIKQIDLYATLLELEGENTFKIRSYQTAVFNLEKLEVPLSKMPLLELEKLQGVGKAIAAKIDDINTNGIFRQLDELLQTIPAGVVEMLDINGLGVKKIQTLWKEHGIEDADQLLQACQNNQIAPLKGFGAKTQENILNVLLFKKANSDKLHYSKAEKLAMKLTEFLKEFQIKAETVGQIRRKLEIIDCIEIAIDIEDISFAFQALDKCSWIEKHQQKSGLFAWRGVFKENQLKLIVHIPQPEKYISTVFIQSAHPNHLAYQTDNQTLLQLAQKNNYASEFAIYEQANMPYIAPELREGLWELEKAKNNELPELIELANIKGILHAHSTYSDGRHSLEAMAQACKDLGYQYLGITDHSKSAFYANGLQENRVQAQQLEIDALNQKLAPFKIFKGIESDILHDGSLDYADDILKTFDFVIASVHSGLKMTLEKATERLIKAIENPFTTILGHPTGRILLDRAGYPIDHAKVIEACAANGVVIEINANPWRLDLDWRWIHFALDKGVKLSINPDSHTKDAIQDTYYGICVARKGGLTKAMTLNSLSVEEISQYFQTRKK